MVTTFFPPYHFGGDATYVWHLSNALAERGHEVTVIHNVDAYRILGGTEPTVAPRAHAGVETIPVASPTPRLAPLVVYLTGRPGILSRTLRDIFSRRSFDVVHFHNISLMGGPGILPFGDGVKLYTMHEHWLVCPMHVLWKNDRRPCEKPACLRCTASFRRPPQLWRYTGHLERSLQHVDVFLSPSEFTASMHHERGFRHPVRVFPYFVPAPTIGTASPEPSRPYFLFVGRLERIKGIRELIDVFGRYAEADLVIAGDGTLGDAVRNQAASLPNVHLLGRVPPEELAPLYRGAVALIVPSVGYEVSPFVTLEAFSHGTPVIAHDLGGLPEPVRATGGGFVYSDEAGLVAAMEALRTEPDRRDALGQLGLRGWRELWSEEPHLQAYVQLITDAAADNLRGRHSPSSTRSPVSADR